MKFEYYKPSKSWLSNWGQSEIEIIKSGSKYIGRVITSDYARPNDIRHFEGLKQAKAFYKNY